jgi:hypothetical protein
VEPQEREEGPVISTRREIIMAAAFFDPKKRFEIQRAPVRPVVFKVRF